MTRSTTTSTSTTSTSTTSTSTAPTSAAPTSTAPVPTRSTAPAPRNALPGAFTVSALPAQALARIREAGVDDVGNPVQVHVNAEVGGAPLRCCLRDAEVGERVALIAWRPAGASGAYAEVGPVFVHAAPCPGPATDRGWPEGFRHRRQLLRAYDRAGRQVDNVVVEGVDAEPVVAELLSRPEVALLHSRNPLAGCFMFVVRPSPLAAR